MCVKCDTNMNIQSSVSQHAVPENRVARVRPTFEEVYMSLAHNIRLRSSCYRMAVGAVISSVDFRYVYSLGYNGNAEGLDDGCDSTEPGSCGCLHAEENAVINCTVPRDVPKYVFVTHLPCVMCAKRLINLGGVKRVYYAFDYRIKDSLDLFDRKGIEYCHLPVASDLNELALFKAAEDFYNDVIVKNGLDKSLIGPDKEFATPYAYQIHQVMKWRDACKSDIASTLESQESKMPFIAGLKLKIQERIESF